MRVVQHAAPFFPLGDARVQICGLERQRDLMLSCAQGSEGQVSQTKPTVTKKMEDG